MLYEVITLFSFRSLPEASLWRGWRILTVSAAIGEERVTEALESSGIEGFATESNSLTRSNPGRIAPAGYLESIDARKRDWFLRDDIRYLYLKETGVITSYSIHYTKLYEGIREDRGAKLRLVVSVGHLEGTAAALAEQGTWGSYPAG